MNHVWALFMLFYCSPHYNIPDRNTGKYASEKYWITSKLLYFQQWDALTLPSLPMDILHQCESEVLFSVPVI